MGFVLVTAWVQGADAAGLKQGVTAWAVDRFAAWDGIHYVKIARDGYPPGGQCCLQAFLPGWPLSMRAVSELTGMDVASAGLLLSVTAGIGAAIVLRALAAERGPDERAGHRAVVYLAVCPYSIYLTAVYTESLFLVLAMGAWWAGRRERWWLAGALTAGAVAVRMNGLCLLAALLVMYAEQARRHRRLPLNGLALVFPVEMWAAITLYFRRQTGSWNAWQLAESKGWGRRTALPWHGLQRGWSELTSAQPPPWRVSSIASFVTVLIGVCLVAAFIWLGRWPEVVYVGGNVALVLCSTTFISAARYGLTWFPAFILMAELTGRRSLAWLHPVVVCTCLPLAALTALSFGQHNWVA